MTPWIEIPKVASAYDPSLFPFKVSYDFKFTTDSRIVRFMAKRCLIAKVM